ncbi:hypothetical protein GOBAR_AA29060 [Gossypium barbadense]|uniref:UDP-glycosyltransferases domain-containing protein n=1 Tax=Gossypium barbadense TaxID=3634 RepID=A0A2P5WKK8_GOSBA|nr:hypothetical protein GOBAR_AA29060 [Gossypium barbadense]
MGKPYVLVIPYPTQGHVIPLVELSQNLAKQGIKISFVNTVFNHKRVLDAFGEKVDENGLLHLLSVPDGLEDGKDRNQLGKLTERLCQVMPTQLKELIHKVNGSDDDKISCVLADINIGLALDVAAELGIPTVGLWPGAVFQLAMLLSIPKFIDDGLIDEIGTPLMKHKMFQLSPKTPSIHPMNLVWLNIDDSPSTQKIMFDFILRNIKVVETTDWWLDQQSPGSVIYVAFGSFTVFDQIQFQELALGLEITERPFIWVVREDITKGKHHNYPKGFNERVGNRCRIVSWAPQAAVLGHSSIACFISHCGWNSTMEGVSNGVPFLCWPYFADQFLNESYISDIWKIGLKLQKDEGGIIRKEEIKSKVEQLVGDENFKTRAVELKQMVEKSVCDGGSSDKVFKNFVQWLKS